MKYNIAVYRLFASNFVWAFLAEALGKASVLFANIYFAKTLLPASYGVFSVAFSLTVYIALLLEVGSSVHGTREVSRATSEQLSDIVNPIITVRFFVGLLLFFSINTLMFFGTFSDEYKHVFMIFSFYILAMSLTTEWVFRGLQRYAYIAVGNFLLIAVVFSSFLFVSDSSDVLRAAIAIVVAYLLNSFVLFIILKGRLLPLLRMTCSTNQALLVYRSSIKFLLSGIFGMGYLLVPSIALVSIYGSYDAGIFNAFFRPVVSLCGLLHFIPMVVFPMMSKYDKTDKQSFEVIHGVLVWSVALMATLSSVILLLSGGYFTVTFLGAAYAGEIHVLNLLILIIPVFALKNSMLIPLISVGDYSSQVNAALAAFVVSVVVGIPLIYWLSSTGAAMSIFLSELLSCVVVYHAYRRLKADGWTMS
ncbi:oligosaccharide flippase family protein [Granulosicoccus antarcticus]|uniref:O-antigen transporter n=1 Tax=Granulosicoccus antarcticus IMCC3135 TaxID=1192854 RepID=A0A2Z2P0C0_9GAMM|nr:oligosaccharide flippase family protein [Granulosicoccus antarcticus]ASJ74570.1 Putative O-antigen transporter [Granulosicoccus antarcticus IMCC3135]